MIIDETQPLTAAAFRAGTGWAIRPEGACQGEICVPLGLDDDADLDDLDLSIITERMGMPVVRDESNGVTAVGPATLGGRALASAIAPDLELPDIDGTIFDLGSLRGSKVVLVAWSPY